jgi:hypothetical protein
MFLNRFKRFALMNKDATVMKDTLKRCAYFLSLIEGPNVEGWSERAYARLDKIQRGTTSLPPDTTAWDLLEKDFLRSLTDYAERERACDELKSLSMRGDVIDEYIVTSASRSSTTRGKNEPAVSSRTSRCEATRSTHISRCLNA